jgi:hypothetical protein
VQSRLNRLPGSPEGPPVFSKLGDALEQCIRTCRQTRPTVKLVKKHLDTLRDGVQLLQGYDAELTDEAIRTVAAANDVLTYQVAQLRELGVLSPEVEAAGTAIAHQLESERPWRDIGALDTDLAKIRDCYFAEREQLLLWQEQQAEAARARMKSRDGFSTLTGDQSHSVLRPFAETTTSTTAEAVAPLLVYLKDPFALALQRAEDQANDLLDKILSEGDKPLIVRVDLRLRNREVETEAEVQALVDEIKTRLLEQVRPGTRVRLL